MGLASGSNAGNLVLMENMKDLDTKIDTFGGGNFRRLLYRKRL